MKNYVNILAPGQQLNSFQLSGGFVFKLLCELLVECPFPGLELLIALQCTLKANG